MVQEVQLERDELRKLFSSIEGKRIILIGHRNSDPDAIASCVALSEILERFGGRSRIGAPQSISKAAKILLERYELEVDIDPNTSSFDVCILVDTASLEQVSPIKLECESIWLIDHHSEAPARESVDVFIAEDRSSCSELVYEIARILGVELSKRSAELLVHGILADTASLRYASPATLRTLADILEKYGLELSSFMRYQEHPQIDISQRIAQLKAAKRIDIYRVEDFLVAITSVSAFEAAAARSLLSLGADLAIVISKRDEEFRIVARVNRRFMERFGFSAGSLMRDLGRRLGFEAGGHDAAAALSGRGLMDLQRLREMCIQSIERFLGMRLSKIE